MNTLTNAVASFWGLVLPFFCRMTESQIQTFRGGYKMATQKNPKFKPEDKDKISQSVLDGMSTDGLSCFKACQKAGVANSTFMRWLDADPKLAERYARAREDLIERIAHETMQIADQDVGTTNDGKKDWMAVQKQRLQVDTRKWLLSKLAPKRYGDKLELSGDPASPFIQRIERVVVK